MPLTNPFTSEGASHPALSEWQRRILMSLPYLGPAYSLARLGGAIYRGITGNGNPGLSVSPIPYGPPLPGQEQIAVSPVRYGPPIPGQQSSPNPSSMAFPGFNRALRDAQGLGTMPSGHETGMPGWAAANYSEILKRNQI